MHEHLLSEIFVKPLIACLLKGLYFGGGRGHNPETCSRTEILNNGFIL